MAISYEEFKRQAGGGTPTVAGPSSTPDVSQATPRQAGLGGFIQEVQEKFGKRANDLGEARASGQSKMSTALQAVGQTAGFVGDAAFAGVKAVTPQPVEDFASGAFKAVAEPVLSTDFAQDVMGGYEKFKQANPEAARNLEASLNIASLIPVGAAGAGAAKAGQVGFKGAKTLMSPGGIAKAAKGTMDIANKVTRPVAKGLGTTAKTLGSPVTKTIGAVAEGVSQASPTAKGLIEGAKNLAQRPGRIIERGVEAVTEKANQADAVKNMPILQKVFEAGVPENVVKAVSTVDKATPEGSDILKAYKEIVDIAKNNETRLGTKKRLEMPIGDRLVKQYELLEAKRKDVGKAIGEKVKELSRVADIDVTDTFDEIKAVLADNGMKITKEGKLVIPPGQLTPKQRNLVKELWDEVSGAGMTRSPRNLYDLDRTLSNLQREARFDGLDNVFLELPGGEERNVFGFFRDVFSNKLEQLDPSIKELNPEYKRLRDLADGVEETLIRETDLKALSGSDKAKFTPSTLRRITSEAVSQGKYEGIADLLDDVARELGYSGASPKELLDFSNAMKDIYGGSIPATGFQGILEGGLMNVPGNLMKAGAPNIKDQQKALEDLLDALNG